ncbi:hypothetical protein Tco_0255018 [Tanacetum coccineum]
MLCYLAGMEPYYLKCIKDGPFQPKTAEGDAKPESQWNADERRVVVQDQHLKSTIMSCLPDDIMELVISCVSAKETWTDLVQSFEEMLKADQRRSAEMRELRTTDHTRQQQLIQRLTVMQPLQREGHVTALQGQVTVLQGQQGPTGGPAQPELPEEAGSSS